MSSGESGTSYALDVVLVGRGTNCKVCSRIMQANQLPVVSTTGLISDHHAFRIEQIPSAHNPDRSVIVPLCELVRGLLPWQVSNVTFAFRTDLIITALDAAGLDAEQVQVKSNYVGISLRELAADW